jgi:hypothetical protein
MFEITYMSALFAALGIGVFGFLLGSLAMVVFWMKSEDIDLKRATSRFAAFATSSSRWKNLYSIIVVGCQPHLRTDGIILFIEHSNPPAIVAAISSFWHVRASSRSGTCRTQGRD